MKPLHDKFNSLYSEALKEPVTPFDIHLKYPQLTILLAMAASIKEKLGANNDGSI